jgi:hypothetical protein
MGFKNFFKGFKDGTKLFGEDISAIINAALLSVVYFLGVGLTAIFAKFFRKDFLSLKVETDKESYWEDLNLSKKQINDYYRQF